MEAAKGRCLELWPPALLCLQTGLQLPGILASSLGPILRSPYWGLECCKKITSKRRTTPRRASLLKCSFYRAPVSWVLSLSSHPPTRGLSRWGVVVLNLESRIQVASLLTLYSQKYFQNTWLGNLNLKFSKKLIVAQNLESWVLV